MVRLRFSRQMRFLTTRTARFATSAAQRQSVTLGSGPHGVDGRSPFVSGPDSCSVAITDPFVLYQNYIAQGLLERDEYQLRTMKEFQKLYHRVVDYTPPEELAVRISLLLRQIELKYAEAMVKEKGKGIIPSRLSSVTNFFRKDPKAEKRQLIKFITDEEELENFASPQGLLVNGEVGCGKSMLMDIFAASLPHKSKMRWHFSNFMLWVYNEIHKTQNEKLLTSTLYNGRNAKSLSMEHEFILFEIAQKMISKNTILMLDEFMLPDIASANIIKILFTYYFKLGGVLVATSNKLPEELYSNEFHKSKFRSFVNILSFRCASIDMRSSIDYRVQFSDLNIADPNAIVKHANESHESNWIKMIKQRALMIPEDSPMMKDDVLLQDLGQPSSFTVYNRVTKLPLTFGDVCYLEFDYICKGLFSSSDYITLASKYRTIVLDNVPVLTTKMKNEARRFIALLDAIYENKCQFYIRSDVPIDYTFFPDSFESDAPDWVRNLVKSDMDNNLEVQNEEMFAKTSIALSSPYRPNVASYDQSHTETYDLNKQQQDDYANMKAFTGEDEKFAFKRAVSRIHEMIGSQVWRNSDRWVPLDESMRPWENVGSVSATATGQSVNEISESMEQEIKQLIKDKKQLLEVLPRDLSEAKAIPFRQFNRNFAPVFENIQHFWQMGKWGVPKRLKDEIAKSWINYNR